jgi:hypothetical protein
MGSQGSDVGGRVLALRGVRRRRKVGVELRGGQDRKAVIDGIEIGETERCSRS